MTIIYLIVKKTLNKDKSIKTVENLLSFSTKQSAESCKEQLQYNVDQMIDLYNNKQPITYEIQSIQVIS